MAKKPKRKPGRPAVHDRKHIASVLLTELAKGRLVKDVCAELHIEPGTVRQWAAEDAEFAAVYARAREEQAHAIAEDAVNIADEKTETSEAVQRNRLRVEARKWMASKIAPRTYGERQVTELEGALTVTHKQVWKIGDKEILF